MPKVLKVRRVHAVRSVAWVDRAVVDRAVVDLAVEDSGSGVA